MLTHYWQLWELYPAHAASRAIRGARNVITEAVLSVIYRDNKEVSEARLASISLPGRARARGRSGERERESERGWPGGPQ